MKTCSKCGQDKTRAEFSRKAVSPDGLRPRCKTCVRAEAKVYREANPERMREFARNWRVNHPELAKAKDERRRRKNRQHQLAMARQWKRDNIDRVYSLNHAYRIRVRTSEGNYTQAQWQTLLLTTGGVCVACGNNESITVDHILPLSLGGSNSIENLQPLCSPCNSRKSTRTVNYLIVAM